MYISIRDAEKGDSQSSFNQTSSHRRSSLGPKRSCMNEEGKMRRIGKLNRSFGRYMKEDLDSRYMTNVLVVLFFISGLIDSVTFNSWSSFVCMQSVEAVSNSVKSFVPYCNSIFAALGLSGQPVTTHRQAYYKSLTSIGSFCLGAAFFSALHRAPYFADAPSRHRRRFVFFLSFLLQTCLILITASLVHVGLVSSLPAVSGTFSSGSHRTAEGVIVQGDVEILTATNYRDLAPIAFLAFQAAGQVALSRVLELNELPTVVLSSVYFDCVADLYSVASSWAAARSWYAFFFDNEKRAIRRLTSIVSLVLGGFVGGLMFKSRVGMSGAFWLAGGMKGIICISWLFWRSQAPKGDERSLTRSTERTMVQG